MWDIVVVRVSSDRSQEFLDRIEEDSGTVLDWTWAGKGLLRVMNHPLKKKTMRQIAREMDIEVRNYWTR